MKTFFYLILFTIILVLITIIFIIYLVIKNIKDIKRAKEEAKRKAEKCPYKIEEEDLMAKTHKKITITIPIELDRLIDSLVEESKKTAKPISKSSLIVVSVYDYLSQAKAILDSQNSKKEEN